MRRYDAASAPRVMLVAALAAMLLAASADTASANRPAPNKATARYEVKFMTSMIDHHAMAIEMAELCAGRTVHAELQALCDQIIATQQQEIDTMRAWLASWHGVSYTPKMTSADRKMLDRMASMSGAEFETEFMKMMIEHH